MDEGVAAVVGAAIGIVGASLGAVGGWLGGRAQSRGQVDAMKLQLQASQDDALWTGRRQALARLLASHEELRSLLASMAVAIASGRDGEQLVGATRAELDQRYVTLVYQGVAAGAEARLWVPDARLQIAAKASDDRGEAVEAMNRWRNAVDHGSPEASRFYDEVTRAMLNYRATLQNFAEQARLYLEHRG
ncbi:hypothetical protein [Kitasatospora sp. CB02891]|uniref:hypothetical protein n=1 Tax=Kitasatospora sp. CB02891 TaxID=2020329 RepID=UPI000C26DFD3|nr:hypothetical protein [Kitasatospora sp. CB02891]PJN24047.1 hypothetical protein CG736_19315 [Kitasatospora sp. CB02891]